MASTAPHAAPRPADAPASSPQDAATPPKLHGWEWYRSLGSPRYAVAPMVDQSELPFRLLCRDYGADIAWTPMLNSRMMVASKSYMGSNFSTCPEDRPLIAQIAGHDPETMLAAGRMVEPFCDAVDVNFGCPQGIARRGRYGAFLLEEPDTVVAVISALAQGLRRVPVTAKIRVLPSFEATMELVLRIQDAGASLITIHGRTKENKKQAITAVDWDIIARIRAHPGIRVPIFANGGVADPDDVAACLAATGVEGVMSSEALLENPGLFSGGRRRLRRSRGGDAAASAPADPASDDPSIETSRVSTVFDYSRQYLAYAESYPATPSAIKGHLMKLLFGPLSVYPDLKLALARMWPMTPAVCRSFVTTVEARYAADVNRRGTRSLLFGLSDALAPAAPEATAVAAVTVAEGEGERMTRKEAAAAAEAAGSAASASSLRTRTIDYISSELADEPPCSSPDSLTSLIATAAQTEWETARADHPAVGLVRPDFLFDPAVPGRWYMRHRVGVYAGLCYSPGGTNGEGGGSSSGSSCGAGEGGGEEGCSSGAGAAPAAPATSTPTSSLSPELASRLARLATVRAKANAAAIVAVTGVDKAAARAAKAAAAAAAASAAAGAAPTAE